MSVNSIDSTGGWPLQTTSTQTPWQNVLTAASSALGLSTSAVQQQLQAGASLSAIANTQGVSQQSLVQAITSALTQNGQPASASSGQLQQVATSLANRTLGSQAAQGHHHHHHGGGASNTVQTEPLVAALTGGSTSTSSYGQAQSSSGQIVDELA